MEDAASYFLIIFALAAILLSAGLFYYYHTSEKTTKAKPKTAAASAPSKPPPAPVKISPKPGAFVIPPFVPRNRETLKIIAEERPDLILKIVKNWLQKK
jgi:hypothetical protein